MPRIHSGNTNLRVYIGHPRDTRSFKGKVKSVTFNRISEQLYYEREHIESIQMLHYRTTSIDRIFESRDVPYSSFQFVDSAEIILYYAASLENMEVDTTHTTLHCRLCLLLLKFDELSFVLITRNSAVRYKGAF